jgi:asparagine synthase (glutamine-hydrolysing)
MCGIAGLIGGDGVELERVVAAMCGAMRHRGPDGEGAYAEPGIALGMRRLAVIDLAHGGQPLTSRDGRVVAFQNGEIYNHRELRRLLEAGGMRFRTDSDTEVLAHGYSCWGIDGLLARVDGMFALAILDRDARRLHLARDRFGEKPLFYAHEGARFAWASSLDSLSLVPWLDDEVDPRGLERYLALHYVAGERTILRGARRVLPGERLEVDLDAVALRRQRYHELALDAPPPDESELAERIERAVASRLIADVPVGVFLSGGLDSSLVAAVAARHAPGIRTFSMGFATREHDESAFAAALARHVGSDHRHFRFDDEAFATLLPQVVAALDEPIGDQAALPLFWLAREARRDVTVVLSGEAADEVFAGYGYYRPFAGGGSPTTGKSLWRRLAVAFRSGAGADGGARPPEKSEGPPARLLREAPPVTPSGFPLLTDGAGRARLTGRNPAAPDAWEVALLDWLDRARDPLQRATAADLATWLPDDLLVKFDRMTMAHSLEGRAPYLAPGVVESGIALPAGRRMTPGVSKVALREVARRWLPRDILERPKQGFVLPMGRWLRDWFAAHGGPFDYFAARPFPGLDGRAAADLVAEDLTAGLHRERLLLALVMLVEWKAVRTERLAALRAGDGRAPLAAQASGASIRP